MQLKNKNNLIYFIIFFLVFLIIYTYYRSNIIFQNIYDAQYKIYYNILFTLLFFFIFLIFFKKKYKDYFIIIFSSCIVTIYIFEGYLTIFDKNKYKKSFLKKYDSRNIYQIYIDKKKGEDITITVPPWIYHKNKYIQPLSGISNKKTIFCNEDGYYAMYKSDRYGFNNPDSEWDKNEIEYLLLGDSFTHGSCVNRPFDIGSVLRTLSNKSVLNLGYNGNGPLKEYASLKEYSRFQIKNVIWLYYPNDNADLKEELKSLILKNYLDDNSFTQNLIEKQKEIDKFHHKYIKYSKKLYENEQKNILNYKLYIKIKKFIKIEKFRNNFPEIFQVNYNPKPEKEFKEIIHLANKYAISRNMKFYFVYIPAIDQRTLKMDKRNHEIIKKTINELNIPIIDLYEIFSKEENLNQIYPLLGDHFNIRGYEKVAKTIFNATQNY